MLGQASRTGLRDGGSSGIASWRTFSRKVQDEGLAGEGSRRRSRTKAWLEKVLDEGPERRLGWRRFSTNVQDEDLAG